MYVLTSLQARVPRFADVRQHRNLFTPFALESAMDELAYALDIDPVELRLRNDAPVIDPHTGRPWSSRR